MTHVTKLAAGFTGLAAIAAISSPARAQVSPYGQVAPYGGANNGIVGAIVNAVTGYGQHPRGNYGYEQTAQRGAVEMCARTAEQRLNSDHRYNGYTAAQGQRRNGYARNGAGNSATFRVIGITNVERKMNGALIVLGIASSDSAHGHSGWNQPRGDGQRHGADNDHGTGNDRYRNAGMDYRFTCKINSRGAVTRLSLDRGTRSSRG